MFQLPFEIQRLVDAEKQIAVRPKWNDQSNPRYLEFVVPLTADGVTQGGFEMRAKVSREHIGRDAMMQLEYTPSSRRRLELWRCCWKPFHVHTNKAWGGPELSLQRFDRVSHHHPFLDNFVPNESRMRNGSLPAARLINPDPATLGEFIAFCGECFKINNMGLIEVPQRSGDLFWISDD